tara:strand:- start:1714 stop:2937 length:1224 start_codon:yes stop_codon:yes gene_type:complete
MEVLQNQQMRVDPEYLENARKDLLANVYRTGHRYDLPEGLTQSVDDRGNISYEDANGRSYGESLYTFTDPATGVEHSVPDSKRAYVQSLIDSGQPVTNILEMHGRRIALYDAEHGGLRLPPGISYNSETKGFDQPYDVTGFAATSTLEGVPQPDIMPLTPMQQQGVQMAAQGIGAYEPLLNTTAETFGKGVTALEGTTGAYDPQGYKEYMNPYTEDVISRTNADIDRQGMVDMYDLNQSAIGLGAFGGSRGVVARQENARNIRDQKASFGAKMRMDAVNNAQTQSMSAFDNQMKRGQTAGQVFQGLGTAQGGLAALGQEMAIMDQGNVLAAGGLEQQQMQAEYDVQRQSAIEQRMEPYARFGFVGDTIGGFPSYQSTITSGAAPHQPTLGSTVATAQAISQLGKKRQ